MSPAARVAWPWLPAPDTGRWPSAAATRRPGAARGATCALRLRRPPRCMLAAASAAKGRGRSAPQQRAPRGPGPPAQLCPHAPQAFPDPPPMHLCWGGHTRARQLPRTARGPAAQRDTHGYVPIRPRTLFPKRGGPSNVMSCDHSADLAVSHRDLHRRVPFPARGLSQAVPGVEPPRS